MEQLHGLICVTEEEVNAVHFGFAFGVRLNVTSTTMEPTTLKELVATETEFAISTNSLSLLGLTILLATT